ncbi:MAG: CoA transferase [Phreatobacter sp.]|uniref:CaiB/BaiF CoA transferase family protein n=1 Tax=Phreatobacter sp. TaxID=1966341 RepID=UPI001A451AC8|nr:CoA transferase [Phreatobacter sp.]MBL8570714.1 CoA transferase [Phreatobacter sp.]
MADGASENAGQPLPLAGLRVLDLTQIYNGPYATFLMAMAGAEVIKVEPPGGEFLRRRDARSGAGVPFAMLNANKRSISLNLKTPRGRDMLLDLVRQADVVAENFAPGVMDRLGLGYEALRAINPRIIYASGSGYGSEGPYRDYPAMDLTVQAMSGVMSITGFSENAPVKSGAALCDFFGGVHLYGAITTALFARERSGRGCRIEVAMLEAVYPSLASSIGMTYGERDDIPIRTGNRHGGLSLCPYNVYPASDGFVAIICNSDKHWLCLVDAMARPDLKGDARMATMRDRVAHMDEIDGLIAKWTSSQSRDELFTRLAAFRVPSAPVRDLPEVIADPHMHERGMLLEVDHPQYGRITVCRSPINYGDAARPDYRVSPAYAADNAAVYGEMLGIPAAELAALRAEGVV